MVSLLTWYKTAKAPAGRFVIPAAQHINDLRPLLAYAVDSQIIRYHEPSFCRAYLLGYFSSTS
jgi:hypothetical protein